MSLHVLAHPWEVQDVADGTAVRLTYRDLDVQTLSIWIDELVELARESDRPTLYLDFEKVQVLTSVVLGKLFVLDRRLREIGGGLVPCNLNLALREIFRTVGWPNDAAGT
jgi:anti-anti-sigma regulatory factor